MPSDVRAQGKIVVCNDQYPLSDLGGFATVPADATRLAQNVATWFTGGAPGSFLVYSTNHGLTGTSLATVMTGGGHTWIFDSNAPFTLSHLMNYDAVFLGGEGIAPVADVLTDYVNCGRCVYLTAGCFNVASVEAATWNPFLNAFGLSIQTNYNTLFGAYPISSTHPVLAGVILAEFRIGNDVTLTGSNPDASVYSSYFGFYDGPGSCQNLLHHYDGTAEASSRGQNGTLAKDLLQRYPADQICAATLITGFSVTVQDQNAATPEGPVILECRRNDNTAGARPLYGPPPLGTLNLGTITFPGSGVVSLTISACNLSFPVPGDCGTPQGDVYVGLRLPAAPSWPADGISVHVSTDELMCPAASPYAATPTLGSPLHSSNMAWDVTNNALIPTVIQLAPNNLSWRIGVRFKEDTLQPFADNIGRFTGGPAGLNPNYGYPGIFPNLILGDRVGFNVQSSLPVGSLYFLAAGPQVWPGVPLLSVLPLTEKSATWTCIVPDLVLVGITVPNGRFLRDPTFSSSELAPSQVTFGPYPLPALLCGIGALSLQGFGLSPGGAFQVSASGRVQF